MTEICLFIFAKKIVKETNGIGANNTETENKKWTTSNDMQKKDFI